ncbi:hypothetical protein CIW83_09570 [Tissierella sp. P1]|uniref:hypothetical protein n=1 Tax=Tissierella sp. P1 TaxID=1280483 RepID=UPI000B9FACFE|nr:hypothetical protein [Tissierella sp. P1]OZV12335.1 hypothetical protein CIW83_09570 [Tissierella sp. P1]
MRMAQVIDGEIVQYGLPTTGELKDGSSVSGYHLQDIEILLAEGWLPLEDVIPEHDVENQYILDDGYEILEDKVIKKYKIEDKIIPEPEIIDEYVDDEKVAMAEALLI